MCLAKKITWWQAAEIIGITDRQMRRWHWRYKEYGYDGLLDRRLGKLSPKRVPLAVVEQVFSLFREKYFDLNVRHFHEKLGSQHQIRLSYTWVKKALQGAGLVSREHHASGSDTPYRGCCCTSLETSDAGSHRDDRWYDLLVILDDATSRIYYAQLVEEESTMTVLGALRKVVEQEGIFCALYSDRASHFFWTPRAGGKVRSGTADEVGRALKELGDSDDTGLLPASARAFGAGLWDLARTLASGIALARDGYAGASQCFSGAGGHGRVQSALSGAGVAGGERVSAVPKEGSGCAVFGATGAGGESG